MVDVVPTDPEGRVVSSESELAELGCELNPGGSKKAVPVVERNIRNIKRGSEASLTRCPIPYPTA
jgi:hypothetical protein